LVAAQARRNRVGGHGVLRITLHRLGGAAAVNDALL
jgi:hypothetical protein